MKKFQEYTIYNQIYTTAETEQTVVYDNKLWDHTISMHIKISYKFIFNFLIKLTKVKKLLISAKP